MLNLPLNVDFTGKVVVITGAGGVLCSTMARAFAQAGAKVAALDLNEDAVKKLAEEARSIGQEYYSNQMNQCVSASVSSISIFSKTKTALLLLLCAYAVFWARKTVKEFSAPQEGER